MIERYRWEMTGRGTLAGLFSGEDLSVGMASPTGTDHILRAEYRLVLPAA
jgi:hypothetical protein